VQELFGLVALAGLGDLRARLFLSAQLHERPGIVCGRVWLKEVVAQLQEVEGLLVALHALAGDAQRPENLAVQSPGAFGSRGPTLFVALFRPFQVVVRPGQVCVFEKRDGAHHEEGRGRVWVLFEVGLRRLAGFERLAIPLEQREELLLLGSEGDSCAGVTTPASKRRRARRTKKKRRRSGKIGSWATKRV